ncbi:hypothetical protein LI328DRAFT_46940 [Trichoderma asperelloides]|nr:hypothetical protein LI328DRAFT_46940 [Trichoderma asperelloides]
MLHREPGQLCRQQSSIGPGQFPPFIPPQRNMRPNMQPPRKVKTSHRAEPQSLFVCANAGTQFREQGVPSESCSAERSDPIVRLVGLDPPAHRTGCRRLNMVRSTSDYTEMAYENESQALCYYWLAGRLNGLTVKLDKEFCIFFFFLPCLKLDT